MSLTSNPAAQGNRVDRGAPGTRTMRLASVNTILQPAALGGDGSDPSGKTPIGVAGVVRDRIGIARNTIMAKRTSKHGHPQKPTWNLIRPE
jgi:hypothetical protein